MNKSKTILKILTDRKRVFWLGHLLFWVYIFIESSLVFPQSTSSFLEFLIALTSLFSGFVSSLGLRYIYRYRAVHKKKIWMVAVEIYFFSFLGGVAWTFLSLALWNLNFKLPVNLPINNLIYLISLNYTTIFLWSCLYNGFKLWEEWNNHKLLLEHERTLIKTAQLDMLKYQLHPHFLFNTLSSLRGLILTEPLKAKNMVTQISEFLRYSLVEGKNNLVQLSREIEIIELYLEIEKIRFNEDLVVSFNIDPKTKDFQIPVFLIHPLVENAVKFGMQTSSLPLRISIKTLSVNGDILIEVSNSGNLYQVKGTELFESTNTGLSNIRKRLELCYPGKHDFDIIQEDGFVIAKIVINNIQ